MRIEIDTEDRELGFDLMEVKSVQSGIEREIPGGGKIVFEGIHIRKALGIPETLELALTFGTGVASGLIANWLFQKLKGRAVRLRIDRVEVEIQEGEIKRVIQERIETNE